VLDLQVPTWISVYTTDRNKIVERLGTVINDELATNYVLKPGNNTRVKFTKKWAVLDFYTVYETDRIVVDTVTIMAGEDLVITITDKSRTAADDIKSLLSSLKMPVNEELVHLVYLLLHELASDNLQIVANARKQVENLARSIDEQPQELEPTDIMSVKRDLGVIFSVIEDEYHSVSYLTTLRFRIDSAKYRRLLNETAEGLGQLKRSVERTENRLESIHLQYILTLQDTTNKRLNTLTIVNAIFVPLTLIAGIYGMNFVYMPELQWELSYFSILGLMGLIAGCELLYFYTKGWFR
jgi:magnesium transporter